MAFDYFIGWLIARGERFFQATLRDPETTLLPVAGQGDLDGEAIIGAAWDAYQAATGQELPPSDSPERELVGEPWDEATVDSLFPRLAARCSPDA